ncbi:MAG TPA: TonB-dependent receptor [Steroidobacteraceae bacterium]|nr:TonB-dependent receptor [Steroidobacteraceae bacterium]
MSVIKMRGSAALLAAVAAVAAPARAQDDPDPDAQARTIGAITVTAQKREQNLQDVPLSVTAISSQLLADTGVSDIKELTLLTPGLLVTSTSNETVTTARIRGIGTVGDNAGLESSVGIVIDGVYRPRNGVSFGDLGELERIEILKGPQGTLFGKNTSAGVINIITKAPQTRFGSELEVAGGNEGMLEGSVSLTGPIGGESVAGRLYVAHRERDGFYTVSTGDGPRELDEDSDRKFTTVRGQLAFDLSESFEARVIADYTDRDEVCCGAVQVNRGPTAPIVDALATDSGTANPVDPFARGAFLNRPTDQDIEDKGISAELNWNLGAAATLTSITGWRDWQALNGQDSDFSTADILYRNPGSNFGNSFEQLSEELRLAGELGRLNWMVGAFYADEKLESRNEIFFGTDYETYLGLLFSGGTTPTLISQLNALPFGQSYVPGTGQRDRYEQDAKSWALFTNNALAITEALELTVGLRYTSEEKDLLSRYDNVNGGIGCATSLSRVAQIAPVLGALTPTYLGTACSPLSDFSFTARTTTQSRDEEEWSGTGKLAYRFSEAAMAYGSYARGYKAGGFNLDRERVTLGVPDPDTSFPAEMVDSYEIGLKTTWLEGALLLNAAGFHQEYENFQLNTFTGIQFIVASIPEVRSKGADLELVWLAGPLTVQGGVTYSDTEFGDFTPTAGISPRLPNNQVSCAPYWSSSLSLTLEQPVGSSLVLRGNVGGKYTSEYNTGSDLNPGKAQDELILLNARLGFGREDGRWMIEAWSMNLTDEEYHQVIFDATLQTGTLASFLGAPRTYGLTLRSRF